MRYLGNANEARNLNLRRIRYKLSKSIAQRGIFATLIVLIRKSVRRSRTGFDRPKEFAAVHPFDRQFGVETSGLIPPEDLFHGKPKDFYNAGYFGVAPSVLRQILDRLRLPYEQYTFIDLGSGKGRALLIASEYPFCAVAGVELSAELHAVAIANIARYQGSQRRCAHLTSVEADAAEFVFPAGPLVLYLWNPFEAPVLASVLANLEVALFREPRPALLIYVQPDLEWMLEGSKCWRRLWREEVPLSEEDYAAHAFPPKAEICAVYRSVLP